MPIENFEYSGFNLVKSLCEDPIFFEFFSRGFMDGSIRYFGDDEWKRVRSQNYSSPTPEIKEFEDMFRLGYNIGNCVGASMQLSYSYDDVDIVSGTLPIIKGTLNAEKEGGHCWLETSDKIIDTSLMLVIDKKLK